MNRVYVMKSLAVWIVAAGLICGVAASASGAGDEGPMPDLNGAVGWLNSAPLSSKSLRNKYWPADYFIDRKGRIRH
jgi:heme/copper-type cytochrome/quinol oxidase subunit 1